MLTLKQITKAIPFKERISYYIEIDGYYDHTDRKTYDKIQGNKFKIDEAKHYLDIMNLINDIMGLKPIVHILDTDHDIIIEYSKGRFNINISEYPEIIVNEILSMIKPKLPVNRESLLNTMTWYLSGHYDLDIVDNNTINTFAQQEFERIRDIMRRYYNTGEEEGDACSPFDFLEDDFKRIVYSRIRGK